MHLCLRILGGTLLLGGCGGDWQPPTRPAPSPHANASADYDGDGHLVPDDCQDSGFRWATVGSPCDGASQLVFDPSDGQNAKDFALIDDDGEFHIFHIRGVGNWGSGDNETTFGHESSSDFMNWTAHAPLDLRGDAGEWNDRNLWSPQVLRMGNKWWMYYTGVSYEDDRAHNLQRIGLAISQNLINWHDASTNCEGVGGAGCLLDCEAAWSLWGSGGEYTGDCRDPFVLPVDGGYVMFLTARRSDYQEVIARASSSDGLQWTLVDFVDVTAGVKAESPTAMWRNGRVELYWSASNGVVSSWADDPMGQFSSREWVFAGFAAELIPFADGSYAFPYAGGGVVSFQKLAWNASGRRILDWNVSPACWVMAEAIHPKDVDPINGVDDNCDGYADLVRLHVPPGEPDNPPKRKLPFAETVRGGF